MTMTDTPLDDFFESAGTPLAILDPGGAFLHLNGAWREVLADPDGARSKPFQDIFKAEDAARVREIIGQLRGDKPRVFDARISVQATGAAERVVRFHLTQDASSKRMRVIAIASPPEVGVATALTKEQELEAQLQEKLAVIEQQKAKMNIFEGVLQTASVYLWAMDHEGICTVAEGKGLALLGLDPKALIGANLLEVFKDNEDVVGHLIRALGGEERRTITNPAPGVYVEGWHMPLRHTPDGEISGVIGFSIDSSERVRNEMELREKLELIQRQSATIRTLATPIIQVWDGVLCLPVIGTVDSARTADMMESLLEAIVRERARCAILDLTGVEVVDTSTASHLIQLFKAAKLLGVDGILCGIRPAVAQTVVALGLEMSDVRVMRSLRDALKWCLGEQQRSKPTG
jgi:anti-anti-sigma factor